MATAQALSLIPLTRHIAFIQQSTNTGILTHRKEDGSQEAYFIDSGTDGANALTDLALAEEKLGAFSLKAIINTHSHADHCGGNRALIEKTGCEIWATKGEAALLTQPLLQASLIHGSTPLPELRISYLQAEASCAQRILPVNTDIILNDSLSIRLIPLPGHYIDMAAVLVTDRAPCGRDCESGPQTVLFLSDGISGRNVIRRYWIQYVYDEGLFKQSLEKIKTLKAAYYVPGHGDAVREIEGLVELNQIAVLETEALILEELSQPKSFEELLKAVADRNGIPLKISQYELIGSTLRSYLSSLHAGGRIACRIVDNRLYWSRAQ